MDAGVAVYNLPAGWSCAATRDGRFFFVDDQQRRTTWVHPATGHPVQSGLLRDPGLPSGWEVAFDDFGQLYYVDHINCLTTYDHPTRQLNVGEKRYTEHDQDEKIQRSPFQRVSSKKKHGFSRSSGKAPVAKRDYNSPVTLKGWLYRQEGAVIKQWKKRWCVLVDLCLYCYESDNELQTVLSIILPGYRVSCDANDDSSSHKFAFKVEHDKLKSYHFATDRDSERNEWVDTLTQAATLQNDADHPSPLRVSTNLRRFPDQEDLSPNAGLRQLDWGGDLKPGFDYAPSNARMNNYEFERDRSYPDADPRYDPVQSGYIAEGYPEGLVMREKSTDTPYYPYHPQRNGFEDYPERDSTQLPVEYIRDGNTPARATATTPATSGALVSGSPQDLYAKVIKPSERDQNMVPRHSHHVDTGRPNFERGPDGSISSSASFTRRHDGGRIDDRRHPGAAPSDVSLMQQPDLQPNRDYNYNDVNKPSGTDGPSRAGSQPRVYRPGERHIDGTPMFGDPSKDASRLQMTSPNARPNQLPLPSSIRAQYIDELAAAKTPQTQHDLMQAKDLSQRRHGQPSYFQYPERDTARQMPRATQNAQHTNAMQENRAVGRGSGWNNASVPYSNGGSRDMTRIGPAGSNIVDDNSFLGHEVGPWKGSESSWRGDELKPTLNPQPVGSGPRLLQGMPQDSFRIADSELSFTAADGSRKAPLHDESFHSGRVPQEYDSSQQQSYANMRSSNGRAVVDDQSHRPGRLLNGSGDRYPPLHNSRPPDIAAAPRDVREYTPTPQVMKSDRPLASRGIQAIKEDPDMLDSELSMKTLEQLKKHLSGHVRLRLSISTGDLGGKTREELVLLLIQLRRSQMKLEEMRIWVRGKLAHRRPDEKAYRLQRENSVGRLSEPVEQNHEYFTELQNQTNELDKQIEITQPLINLLDNMVTMGSLYGADNLLYAAEYKKHQLPPDQQLPSNRMVEFSRHHQEERLASKQKQSLRQLTEDEVKLEDHLQQLYRLDRVVQEHSFNVTSLHEDKAVLEKTLDDVKQAEDQERDSYALMRLSQRRQVVEQKLTKVRQQLADSSKLLEEASAENTRVEQEVIILRNKVYGVSRDTTTAYLSVATSGNGPAVAQMEQELNQVRSLMEGLSTQGSKLSETMQSMKPPVSDAVPSSARGTYLETDFDRSATRDISIHSRSNAARGMMSQRSAAAERPLSDAPNKPSRAGHDQSPYRQSQVSSAGYSGLTGGRFPAYRGSTPQSPVRSSQSEQQPQWYDQNSRHPNTAASSSYVPRRTGSNENVHRRHPDNVADYSRAHYAPEYHQPTRDVVKHEPAATGIEDPLELRRTKSMPRVGSGYVDRRNPSHGSPYREEPSVRGTQSNSAVNRLYQPYTGVGVADPRTQAAGASMPHQYTAYMGPTSTHQAGMVAGRVKSSEEMGRGYQPPGVGGYRPTAGMVGGQMNFDRSRQAAAEAGSPRSAAQRLWNNQSALPKTRSFDDLIKEEPSKTLEFDDKTIDRELQYPEPVRILERYDPDVNDEEQFLTEEERQLRREKSEKYKKMLAAHSLQEFTTAELSSRDGPLHIQVDDEMKRREHLLNIKQQLAQQVMEKSKDAAVRRKSNPAFPQGYVPGSPDRDRLTPQLDVRGFVPVSS